MSWFLLSWFPWEPWQREATDHLYGWSSIASKIIKDKEWKCACSQSAMYFSFTGYFVRKYLLVYIFKQKDFSILRKSEKILIKKRKGMPNEFKGLRGCLSISLQDLRFCYVYGIESRNSIIWGQSIKMISKQFLYWVNFVGNLTDTRLPGLQSDIREEPATRAKTDPAMGSLAKGTSVS